MNYKILFQIAFASFLFAFLMQLSWLVGVIDYIANIVEISVLSGFILFSIGLYQLNKRMLIPSIVLIIFSFIALVIDLLQSFEIYNLPIDSNFGWTLYSLIFFKLPPLLFLIFLKISNENIKIDNKLFIPILLMGISVFARILLPLSVDNSEGDYFIYKLLLYIQSFSDSGSFLVATSTFIWFNASDAPITKSKKSVIDINEPMTVGDWLLTYLTLVIPIVNIVMPFIWAFSSNTNVHKSTWAKALLIWFAILFTLYILVFVIIFSNSF